MGIANDYARKKAKERKPKHPQPPPEPPRPTLTIINPDGTTTEVKVHPLWPPFQR